MIPLLRSLWSTVKKAADPDRVLQATTTGLIHLNATRYNIGEGLEEWQPGKPLKLILAGYVGTRNTGADVRVEEMIRQFRAVLGDDNIELSIMSVDKKLTASYFRTVRQVTLPAVFPKFLYDECPKHHGVIACEGSMFKSKFANALSTFMAGALGMASAENKLSLGYGAEAGAMNPPLRAFVQEHCRDSLIICRNNPSRMVLERLGVRTKGGTDTAWTFTPAPRHVGAELLKKQGWDGQQPVLIVCPINPFWWPVKPDLGKAFAHEMLGEFDSLHYKSVYFHHDSQSARDQQETYTSHLARAIEVFCREQNYFPILVGMEKVDRRACQLVASKLPYEPPMFVSDEYNMYELVSVLHNGSLMASSRYHAIVTSMPGLVPSVGVTMDERIRNLMNDRGHPDFFLEVDDEQLSDRLISLFRKVHESKAQVKADIARVLPGQLKLMGQMGMELVAEIARVYPEFPVIDRPQSWEAFLPPLPQHLTETLEQYA